MMVLLQYSIENLEDAGGGEEYVIDNSVSHVLPLAVNINIASSLCIKLM